MYQMYVSNICNHQTFYDHILYMWSYLFNLSGDSWHQRLYIYSIYLSYFLFAIAYTGIIAISPDYLQTLNSFIKYYVSLFLVIRFNPFIKSDKHKKIASFDRRIAFSAGMFLLLTTTAIQVAKSYITDNIIFSGRV